MELLRVLVLGMCLLQLKGHRGLASVSCLKNIEDKTGWQLFWQQSRGMLKLHWDWPIFPSFFGQEVDESFAWTRCG